MMKYGIVAFVASTLCLLAEASSNAITAPAGHTPYKHLTSATELIVERSGGLPEGFWLEPLPTNQKLYTKPLKKHYKKPQKFSKKDVAMLAKNLYFEYRDEDVPDSYIAQVGYVVLNRVNSEGYPDTLEEVIWQRGQFSWTRDGKSDKMVDKKAAERSHKIAEAVLLGKIPNKVGNATHYLNKNASEAAWWRSMKYRGRFGAHTFYEEITN